MTTKIVATMLGMIILGIVCLNMGAKTQAQDSTGPSYQSLSVITNSSKGKDTVTTKVVIDSAKIVRDQFVAQKEDLKGKIQVLQETHRRIKETQRQIDSVTVIVSNYR